MGHFSGPFTNVEVAASLTNGDNEVGHVATAYLMTQIGPVFAGSSGIAPYAPDLFFTLFGYPVTEPGTILLVFAGNCCSRRRTPAAFLLA